MQQLKCHQLKYGGLGVTLNISLMKNQSINSNINIDMKHVLNGHTNKHLKWFYSCFKIY